jgi:hypothetical protein
MSGRNPTVTLSTAEGAKLRLMLRTMGPDDARKALGNIDAGTLYKAASEVPIARPHRRGIRGRLDRI